MAVDQLQIRLTVQKFINRALNARVVDVEAALPEVNLLAQQDYTSGVQAGPIYVILLPTASATIPVAAPIGGTTKKFVSIIADNPVQVGLDATPSGPDTNLFVTMPNGVLGAVQLKNNSATLTVVAKIFIHGS